jgi:hypothetical protein
MGLERAFPGEELFLRQLVPTASFLESNFAATYRGDHRGLAARHPSLGSRGRQAFRGRSSDHRLTGSVSTARYGASGGSTSHQRGPSLADPPRTVALHPLLSSRSTVQSLRASPFPLFSRSFDVFERVCHQFFEKKCQSPLRNKSSPSPAIKRSKRRLTPLGPAQVRDLVKSVHLNLPARTRCNRHAENGPIQRRPELFTYYSR